MSPILQAIIALLQADPSLLKELIGGIGGLFHHGPQVGSGPGGGSPAPVLGPSPIAGPAGTIVVKQPVAPAEFAPIPGVIKILGAKRFGTPLIPVPAVFDEETSIHLDLQLANPAPWPKGEPDGDGIKPWNPQIVYLWDGQRSDGDPVESGSIDKDGYAGRFLIHALPDDHQHTLRLAFQINGQIGPWLTHSVHKGAGEAPAYHAAFWKKVRTGVDGWEFTNAQHKELWKPGQPGYGCGNARPGVDDPIKDDASVGTIRFCAG